MSISLALYLPRVLPREAEETVYTTNPPAVPRTGYCAWISTSHHTFRSLRYHPLLP